jgi:IS4 transposase
MGSRLRKGEYLLLITEAEPERAPARYARRWEIETLFKACKSQGFDFESTMGLTIYVNFSLHQELGKQNCILV